MTLSCQLVLMLLILLWWRVGLTQHQTAFYLMLLPSTIHLSQGCVHVESDTYSPTSILASTRLPIFLKKG